MGMGAQLSVFSRPRGPVRTWGLGYKQPLSLFPHLHSRDGASSTGNCGGRGTCR